MNESVKGHVALVTGGSAGLGASLTRALVDRGWRVITDARDPARLANAIAGTSIAGIPGDIVDDEHQQVLLAAVRAEGRLDLLVHNASTLGPTPMSRLSDSGPGALSTVWQTNVEAPLRLTRSLLPILQASGGILLSVTSDAAAEHYETWGLYGASKAALEHITLTFAVETGLTAYAVDPGDMRTAMHQAAYPGEDISDRPEPGSVVPPLLTLLARRPPSGRYRAAEFRSAAIRQGVPA